MDYLFGPRVLDDFAVRDGFQGWADMRAFWRAEHPDVYKFNGVLIKWEPT